MTSLVLNAGLRAIERGWPVFPVGADKTPWIRAAHPPGHPCTGECGRNGHGWRDATLDPCRWTGWNRQWPQIPAYGIATPDLVVIDLDTGKGPAPQRVLPDQGHDEPTPEWVVDGMSVLAWIAQRDGTRLGYLTNTFTVATPSGGRHLYYAGPQPLRGGRVVRNSVGISAGRVTGLGWCIDVRAVGGYVLGPGSRIRTTDGTWATYRAVDGARVPRRVPWVLQQRLTAIGAHRPSQPSTGPADRPCTSDTRGRAGGAPTAVGTGRVGGRSRFWDAAVAGELAHIAAAIPNDKNGNGRNATVNRAAYKLGQLIAPLQLTDVDVDQIAEQLRTAAEATGLPAREAHAAVASGLAQGRANPRANPRTLTPPAGRPAGPPPASPPGRRRVQARADPHPQRRPPSPSPS